METKQYAKNKTNESLRNKKKSENSMRQKKMEAQISKIYRKQHNQF